jgi:probable HAF family extracellular repeat protein
MDGNKWDVFDIAEIYRRGTREGVYADRFILNDINDSGYSVGYKYRYGLAGTAAILIDPNITVNDLADVIYLSTPAGGTASDINNNNMIVGTTGSNSSWDIYSQAYILDYNTSSLTILQPLEGGLRSNAYAINDYNQVVGTSETLVGNNTVNHAFLWNQADDTLVDLNDWAIEGWVLSSATAINDNGDIVGKGYLNGIPHGFLLTKGATSEPLPAPVQEPTPVEEPVIIKKGKGKGKSK